MDFLADVLTLILRDGVQMPTDFTVEEYALRMITLKPARLEVKKHIPADAVDFTRVTSLDIIRRDAEDRES